MTDVARSTHRCTILVVDDDRDVHAVLRVALAGEPYSVAFAENGRLALDYLRSHADVCLVLLDLMLPGMDGVQFRSIQLRDRALAWIPVVIASAAIDAERRAHELGATHLIRKPFDVDDLRRTLLAATKPCRKAWGAPAAR